MPEKSKNETGTQIDLLFDRADHVIMLCEIRYHSAQYVIDKNCIKNFKNKIAIFREKTQTKKQILFVLITPYGAKKNTHYHEIVDREITFKDLFK